MGFLGKYQILTGLHVGESSSVRARELASGRTVLIHDLAATQRSSPQSDLASLIFRFLRSAPAEKSGQLLDMGESVGRVFVVTADVPECEDLRQWLQLGTETPGQAGAKVPTADDAPSSLDLDSTRAFTAEAFAQIWNSRQEAPAPPRSAPPAADAPQPGANDVPAAAPPVSSLYRKLSPSASGPMDFVRFWEKTAHADPGKRLAYVPAPPATGKNPPKPSQNIDATLQFKTAPGIASPQGGSQRQSPAGPAEAKDVVGDFAEVILAPPAATKVEPVLSEVELAQPLPKSATIPPAQSSGTKILRDFAELSDESSKAPSPSGLPVSTPLMADMPTTEIRPPEIAHQQIPAEFEVVFQRPESSALPAAPPQAPPDELAPATVAPQPPNTSAALAAPTPAVASNPTTAVAPTVAASSPPAPIRVQPGNYTRIFENTRAVANALPLSGPLGSPPASNRAIGNSAAQNSSVGTAMSGGSPAPAAPLYSESPTQSQPAIYIPSEAPEHFLSRKPKIWVPILILSGLFLMTVGLLIFFAFKH